MGQGVVEAERGPEGKKTGRGASGATQKTKIPGEIDGHILRPVNKTHGILEVWSPSKERAAPWG